MTGFHVLRVLANSPAADAGLEPWFDYICGVNSTKIVRAVVETNPGHDQRTPARLDSTVGGATESTDYIHRLLRQGTDFKRYLAGHTNLDVYIEPSTELGVSLRWCPVSSSANVWHVLEVHPSSPAEIAGFIPFSDYIIGSPEGILRNEGSLGELVEEVCSILNSNEFLRRPLRLWVYNSTHDIVRVVTIVPDRSWGGDGALGFNIGFGYLHRIPALSSNDTLFDAEVPMQTAFEFAQQTQPPPERKSGEIPGHTVVDGSVIPGRRLLELKTSYGKEKIRASRKILYRVRRRQRHCLLLQSAVP